MTLIIHIDLDNDAFQFDRNAEIERILHEIAERLPLNGSAAFNVHDRNGNTCGSVDIVESIPLARSYRQRMKP